MLRAWGQQSPEYRQLGTTSQAPGHKTGLGVSGHHVAERGWTQRACWGGGHAWDVVALQTPGRRHVFQSPWDLTHRSPESTVTDQVKDVDERRCSSIQLLGGHRDTGAAGRTEGHRPEPIRSKDAHWPAQPAVCRVRGQGLHPTSEVGARGGFSLCVALTPRGCLDLIHKTFLTHLPL